MTTLYTFTGSNLVLSGIAVDKAHNIYFSTTGAIYKVDSLGQNPTYVAGKNGSADGTGIGAGFSGVFELRVNKDGDLVAADENKIRLITPAGVVTTLAGTAAIGLQDGDGNVAAFRFAVGLTIDASGAMYVADDANARIRKIVHK
ncbi:MAG TPA: hypothetical protein VGS79_19935 [Puia sp.]|nr:hypothetical protein [Puia sp.]